MGPVDNLSRCVVCGLRWARTLPSLTASRGPIPPRPAMSQHCARSVATSATARSMRPSHSFGFAEFTAVPSAQCLRRYGQALPCSYAECAGHCGHICLSVPVFQPLLFDTLFKVSSHIPYIIQRCTCTLCTNVSSGVKPYFSKALFDAMISRAPHTMARGVHRTPWHVSPMRRPSTCLPLAAWLCLRTKGTLGNPSC